MLRFMTPLAIAMAAVPATLVAQPGKQQEAPPPPPPPYAWTADLAVKAPIVIDATIQDAAKIKGAEAAGVPPGYVRYYLTVNVTALIRAPGALPAQLGYVYDAKLDSSGRPPKFKKARVLLFARPVAGMDGQIQLVTPTAQIAWSPAAEAMTRSLASAVTARDAPPAILGIANAFHAAGVLPGEGETQIFLKTTGHPISLSVIRKQDQAPVWTVSLTEVVEDALPPPRRDTFLWYRLACGLPRALPAETLSGLDSSDSVALQADYALVLAGLGPCRR